MTTYLLARHAAEDEVCFGAPGRRDAAQLAAYAGAIAAKLPDAAKGSHVVLACSDRYHFAAALLGSWLRGYVVELPANGQPATVHALAASALALLHDRDESTGIDVRALERPSEREAPPLGVALAECDTAAIAYTSGTTGRPVPHTKALAQLLREPEAHIRAFELGRRRIVAAVPPYHIYGLLFGVLVPLLGGGSTSRAAKLLPAELLEEIAVERAQVLVAVPAHLTALAAHAGAIPTHLARVFSSAAPLPAPTARALAERGAPVTEVLGSTETGGIAYRERPDAPWEPLPGVTCRADQEQRLGVDAPWLAPDAPRPTWTADRVALLSRGFRHLGRSDAVVKVGGRRIDLGELETRLAALPGIREARVLALESSGVRGVELAAVLAGEPALDLAGVRRALAEHVDPVAVPRRFRVVAELPRSPTGKLAREELLALFDAEGFPREPLADGRTGYTVPPNSAYFRGHFDGQPILPGVVQLQQLVLSEVRRRFPELGALVRLTRVKFKRTIGRGERLELALTRRSEHVVSFELTSSEEPTASGVLHFRGGAW